MGKKIEISKKRYEELLKAEKKNKKLKKELGKLSYILNEVGAALEYRGHRVNVCSSDNTARIIVYFEAMDGSPREVSKVIKKPADEITPYDMLLATFDAMMFQMFGRGTAVDRTVSAIDIFAKTIAPKIQEDLGVAEENDEDDCDCCCEDCKGADIFSCGLGIEYLSETDELEVTFPDDSVVTSPITSHTREGISAALFSAVAFYMTDELTTEYISDMADKFYEKMAGEKSPENSESEEPVNETAEPKAEVSEESATCDFETPADDAGDIIT